jgi:5-formyltetrahydrofolate cyclo-ligase
MDDVSGVAAAKTALRRRIRAARRARLEAPDATATRAEAGRALAAAVTAYLRTGAPDRPVCRVAAYVALPTEPPTAELLTALRTNGHEVLLPVLEADNSLDWELDGRLLGVEALAAVDLVLTPGLAVDREGRRLGQGGGSYDRALAHVRPGTPVFTLVWDEELLDDVVPTLPHDRPVDGVVTPGRGVLRLPADAEGPLTPGGRG